MNILEDKMDGGGAAFLEDAKRKEEERGQEEQAKLMAQHLLSQSQQDKKNTAMKMMARIRQRTAIDRMQYVRNWNRNVSDEMEQKRKLEYEEQMRQLIADNA